ncbi:hypothetical protein [Polynucleobacter sp. AP-Sving-400A-A2]|uniref:hypothetical protein n=1 Tax=Polynucleobacter sp. AP-Sving-400A-A2 TaxID=2081049 RepID=UPI001BFD79D4|nr:hypothetical protein [Polynucleobacter sp. AP-Sving-400A-A2]QWE14363.1 hypothetical protein C2758_09405 [Polynucleobacter sp. AP-Sving-400A-A2]
MDNKDKLGIAILFCKETTEINLDTVQSWFEAKFVDRINPVKEEIPDFGFISQLADARYFDAIEEIKDVNSLVAVIASKPTGFLLAKTSGLFTDYFFITEDEQVERLKKWNDEGDNLLKFIDSLRYLK